MTRWEWVRVALVGFVAVEAALFVAVGPCRRLPFPPRGELLAFSGDGRTCFGLVDDYPAPPTLHAWDVVTGASRAVVLPAATRDAGCGYAGRFAADGGRVLMWPTPPVSLTITEPPREVPVGYHCWLFDTATGDRIAEPFAASETSTVAWSADGRWFLERDILTGDRGVRVRAAPDGAAVAEIAPRPTEWVNDFVAGPTGATLLWSGNGLDGRAGWAVEQVALPTGRVGRRCELPGDGSWSLVRYTGRAVVARGDWLPPGEARLFAVDFAIDPPSLTPVADRWRYDPDETLVGTILGRTWTATAVSPPVQESVLDRLRTSAGRWSRPVAGPPLRRGRVRFTDHAGRPLATPPGRPPVAHVISPDGRWLAGLDEQGRVELWDIDPPSPRPAVVVAGSATGVVWAWLERRRARRANR